MARGGAARGDATRCDAALDDAALDDATMGDAWPVVSGVVVKCNYEFASSQPCKLFTCLFYL